MAVHLYGSPRTAPCIRTELRQATVSHRSLAKLYRIDPETVAKWRAHTSVLGEPMGPRDRASQHLCEETRFEEVLPWKTCAQHEQDVIDGGFIANCELPRTAFSGRHEGRDKRL